MRKSAKFVFAAMTAIFSAACAHARSYEGPPPTLSHLIQLWVEDSPLLPLTAVLDGCRYWERKGVVCGLVSDPTHANVRVKVDTVKCGQGESVIAAAGPMEQKPGCVDPGPSTGTGTAQAKSWLEKGEIVIYTSCLYDDGPVKADQLRETTAHEMGHQLGISHISTVCDACGEETKVHASGRKICGGPAVMSALGRRGLKFITELDALAFDLRDVNRSGIKPIWFPIPPRWTPATE